MADSHIMHDVPTQCNVSTRNVIRKIHRFIGIGRKKKAINFIRSLTFEGIVWDKIGGGEDILYRYVLG